MLFHSFSIVIWGILTQKKPYQGKSSSKISLLKFFLVLRVCGCLLLFIMTMGGIGSRKNVFLAFSSIWLALREGVSVFIWLWFPGKSRREENIWLFFLPAVTRVQCERMKQKKFFSIKQNVVFGTSQWNHLTAKQPFPKETINNILIYNESWNHRILNYSGLWEKCWFLFFWSNENNIFRILVIFFSISYNKKCI